MFSICKEFVMFKKLWLVLAASALMSGAQTFASVTTTETDKEEEIAKMIAAVVAANDADITEEEIKKAEELASAIIAGDTQTLNALSDVLDLQNQREKQNDKKKKFLIALLATAGAVTLGYLGWEKFGGKEYYASLVAKKNGPAQDGDKNNSDNAGI